MASINQLLDLSSLDIARMSRQELAKTVSQLASAANKRLKRLEQAGIGEKSRPYKKAMESGKFSVAKKTRNQLRNEYKRVRQFLRAKTSTVSGWKKMRAEVVKRLGDPFEDDESEDTFWRAYNQLVESNRALIRIYGSDETQRLLRDEMENDKPLSEREKKHYKDLYPDDERDLNDLSQIDNAVIRTLIELGDYYEEKEGKSAYANRDDPDWSDYFGGWGGDGEEDE